MRSLSYKFVTAAHWMLIAWAGAGFVLALVVHAATLIGVDVQDDLHRVWLAMFCLGPIVFIGLAVTTKWEKKTKKTMEESEWSRSGGCLSQLRRAVIAYGVILLVAAFFTTFGHGTAERWPDGRYMEDSGHGRDPKPITVERYHRIHRFNTLGPSAVGMMFYLETMLNLSFVAKCRASAREQPGLEFLG